MSTTRRTSPTIVDVAAVAGVSRGTASNVFTHPERVRPELRTRVEEVAERLGYAGPDPRARLLRAGRHKAIGFVFPGAYGIVNMIESPYGRELLLGIGEACDAARVGLTLLDGRPEQMESALRDALVDGVVLGHGNALRLLEAARRRRLDVVVLDTAAGPGIAAVTIAAGDGARQAAEHLLRLGHRQFAVVSVRRTGGGPVVHRPGDLTLTEGFPLDVQKLDGYWGALNAAGVPPTNVTVVETVPWETNLYATVKRAASTATAWLVMSDRQALTILTDLRAQGVPVAARPAIVGFDNVPESQAAELTTVSQPVREKGRRAATMLLAGGTPREVALPVALVVRGSTHPV